MIAIDRENERERERERDGETSIIWAVRIMQPHPMSVTHVLPSNFAKSAYRQLTTSNTGVAAKQTLSVCKPQPRCKVKLEFLDSGLFGAWLVAHTKQKHLLMNQKNAKRGSKAQFKARTGDDGATPLSPVLRDWYILYSIALVVCMKV
jgi:hypothetical protein